MTGASPWRHGIAAHEDAAQVRRAPTAARAAAAPGRGGNRARTPASSATCRQQLAPGALDRRASPRTCAHSLIHGAHGRTACRHRSAGAPDLGLAARDVGVERLAHRRVQRRRHVFGEQLLPDARGPLRGIARARVAPVLEVGPVRQQRPVEGRLVARERMRASRRSGRRPARVLDGIAPPDRRR